MANHDDLCRELEPYIEPDPSAGQTHCAARAPVENRPVSSAPTPKEGHHVGRFNPGLPPAVAEAERLAFEAWVKGHSWMLEATWSPLAQQYLAPGESSSLCTAEGVRVRGMWAAWRDRAVLARQGDHKLNEEAV